MCVHPEPTLDVSESKPAHKVTEADQHLDAKQPQQAQENFNPASVGGKLSSSEFDEESQGSFQLSIHALADMLASLREGAPLDVSGGNVHPSFRHQPKAALMAKKLATLLPRRELADPARGNAQKLPVLLGHAGKRPVATMFPDSAKQPVRSNHNLGHCAEARILAEKTRNSFANKIQRDVERNAFWTPFQV